MRRELDIAQPELSNEVLPADSDLAPPEPRDVLGDGAGEVWTGAGRAATGVATTGAGVEVAGVETGAAGVATAPAVVPGTADASTGWETALVVGAVFECA
jgi:hypothetical protein